MREIRTSGSMRGEDRGHCHSLPYSTGLIKGLAELIDFVSYGVETGVSSIFFPAASIALTVNERT